MKQRLFACAAAAVLTFSLCGNSVSALELSGVSVSAETVASGTCGENLTW